MRFAEHVVIDLHQNKVLIDGEEVPWVITDRPDVDLPGRDHPGEVTLRIPAVRIEVIPDMGPERGEAQ